MPGMGHDIIPQRYAPAGHISARFQRPMTFTPSSPPPAMSELDETIATLRVTGTQTAFPR